MDFEFSPEQQSFIEEVEAFLDANDDPEVFDVTRENMAQIVDTPKRRAFMKELGHTVEGWATIMVAMLFMGSVQLICVGILGEYLGRIFNEVKPRPMYIIEEQVAAGSDASRAA